MHNWTPLSLLLFLCSLVFVGCLSNSKNPVQTETPPPNSSSNKDSTTTHSPDSSISHVLVTRPGSTLVAIPGETVLLEGHISYHHYPIIKREWKILYGNWIETPGNQYSYTTDNSFNISHLSAKFRVTDQQGNQSTSSFVIQVVPPIEHYSYPSFLTHFATEQSLFYFKEQYWLTANEKQEVYSSPDLTSWTKHHLPEGNKDWKYIVKNDSLIRFQTVLVSDTSHTSYDADSTIQMSYSTNGVTWSSAQNISFSERVTSSIQFIKNTFYISTYDGSLHYINQSTDGIHWNRLRSYPSHAFVFPIGSSLCTNHFECSSDQGNTWLPNDLWKVKFPKHRFTNSTRMYLSNGTSTLIFHEYDLLFYHNNTGLWSDVTSFLVDIDHQQHVQIIQDRIFVFIGEQFFSYKL